MSSIRLPVVVPDREPLTELEAMRIGDSAYRLAKLRTMLKEGGRIDLSSTSTLPYGAVAVTGHRLAKLEGEAVLSLLIEREELFLASFNVSIEKEPLL